MEWRCAWCGKPHEEDDPPCDNCGHGTFEKAVVRQPAGGPGGDSTTLWICTECGREHTKHSPPCSRCGAATLERREQTVDDSELTPPGYFDLLTPRYVLGFAVALLLGTVLVLGLAGVVDLPGMDDEVPEVEDVPGSADSYEGTSLADVEEAYLDHLDAVRTDQGGQAFDRDEHLGDVARYVNQRSVKDRSEFGGGVESDQLSELLSGACNGRVTTVAFYHDGGDGRDAAALGQSLAGTATDEFDAGDPAHGDTTGVDVHAVDGRLSVVQFTC